MSLIPASFAPTPHGGQIEMSRQFSTSTDDVWRALTTPARLSQWMRVDWLGDDGPLREGGAFDYRFHDTDLESRGRVLKLEPPHLFEHSWFDNVPPGAVVRWALAPHGDGCRLTLTHTFNAADDAPRTAAGWGQLLQRLGEAAGEAPSSLGGMAAWRQARDGYADVFPAAATRDGRKIDVDGAPALRFVRRLAARPDQVWSALVEPEGLARWLQAEAQVDSWVGGRFHLRLGGGATLMPGVIRRWEPPSLLEYTWPEAEANGDSLIRFEIEPAGDGSRLVLTHILTAGGALADFASGWHWHLDALDEALEGRARVFDQPRWAALKRVYSATL